ncbi:MAG TPA: DUF3048 domain-containing protein [Actinomycetales bacterium]|nr:DUF3048 domain-containing protein [Actinomycetales bacterium]
MKLSQATLCAILALALVSACGGEEPPAPTPTPTKTQTPAPEPEPEPEPEADPEYWPLTGVETNDLIERPAVAVKIENSTAARPQTGLDAADVVWETIIDFDVSRLIAVYHSQLPEEIGPIRSVRPVDPDVVSAFGGVLAFSGGQQGVLNLIHSSASQPLSHDAASGGFYRVKWRRAPHNVYGSLEAFLSQVDSDHDAPPQEQFLFAHEDEEPTAVADGDKIETLTFNLSSMSQPSWTWDANAKAWLRSEGQSQHLDRDENPLQSVNVVAVTAPHIPSGFSAQNNAAVPTYDLVGEGDVVVATGGKVLEGTWKKEDPDSPLELLTADGDEVLLAPGNTWVELVPQGKGSVSY